MSYINAGSILPKVLLEEIQCYIDAEYLYIPRKDKNKKSWGEINNSKQQTYLRNLDIYEQYKSGSSAKDIAEKYYLSVKTIYKIITNMKTL
ncbi:MAG: hypothetical protein GYA50_01815 [Eubacteriaceae bacterium]|nr:hypothetical protein [Eubacteriaceae bacterium]